MYAELANAITTMQNLPHDHSYHLRSDVAEQAIALLGVIGETAGVRPPKIIKQGDDAVLFTWDVDDIKRYLSVTEDGVDILHYSKSSDLKCEEILVEDGVLLYKRLISALKPIAEETATGSIE